MAQTFHCDKCGELLAGEIATCPACGNRITEVVLFRFGNVAVTQFRVIIGDKFVAHSAYPKLGVAVEGLPPVQMPANVLAAFVTALVATQGRTGPSININPTDIMVVQ